LEGKVYEEIYSKVSRGYINRTAYHYLSPHDLVADAYIKTKKYFTEKELEVTYDFFKGLFWKNIVRLKMRSVNKAYKEYSSYVNRNSYDVEEDGRSVNPKEFEYFELSKYPVTDLIDKGYNQEEVANMLSVSTRTISKYAHRERDEIKVFLTSPEDKNLIVSNSLKSIVVTDSNGIENTFSTFEQAGEFLGVSWKTVSRKLKTAQPINNHKITQKWKPYRLNFGATFEN